MSNACTLMDNRFCLSGKKASRLNWRDCIARAAVVTIMTVLPTQATIAQSDLVVTSAANNGNSKVLRFDGQTGAFIGEFTKGGGVTDPRGLFLKPPLGDILYVNNGDNRILRYNSKTGAFLGTFASYPNLNPGGAVIGPDGNYYVGARSLGAVLRFNGSTGEFIDEFVPSGIVGFPRGFGFGSDGNFYLASGADLVTGAQGTILQLNGTTGKLINSHFVNDPDLSPLDLTIGLDGNIYVSSEFPFGAAKSIGTVRCYDIKTGNLVRVLDAGLDELGQPRLSRPRGIRFGSDGNLYVSSTGTGSVVRFNGTTGAFIDVFAQYPNLNGQAVILVPSRRYYPRDKKSVASDQ